MTDLDYAEIYTTGFLNHFVKYFWKYVHLQKEDIVYTILPDACFDMVVDYENGVMQNVFLTGVWNEPIDVTVTRGTTLLAVRFKIISAEYLMNREIKGLLNTMTTLPMDFWDLHLARSSDFEKFAVDLSDYMIHVLNQESRIDPRKLKLFQAVYSEAHQTVKDLSGKVAWSSRQINRYFNRQFGLSLKAFLNIVRCNASYKDIVKGEMYPQGEFVDQSHFIKEVKKYTGHLPSSLYKNVNGRFLQLSALKKK